MTGGALFSGGRAGGPGSGSSGGSGSGPKALVEFRAGKMTLGTNNMVTADKRKGLVMVDQSDDQLMHFKWKDRSTGNIEDDLIIFPEDVEFKKVPQCTTGRVFILKFKSSSKKMFFWMQEPKDDKDEEFCKKVNDYLNNPPPPGSARGSGGSGGSGGLGGLDLNNLGDTELQSLLNNMSQQQLMQLFGGGLSGGMGGLASLLGGGGSGGGSGGRQRSSARANRESSNTTTTSSSSSSATTTTSTPATPSTTTTTSSAAPRPSGAAPASGSAGTTPGPIGLAELQDILSGIHMPGQAEGGAAGGSSGKTAVDLSSGLTVEMMQPLLSKPEFIRKMKEFVPKEHQDNDMADEIKGTIQSPQFKQALSLFCHAFYSGELAPLIREFDLGQEAVEAAAKCDMEAFVKALQGKNAKEEKKDEPEDMALD